MAIVTFSGRKKYVGTSEWHENSPVGTDMGSGSRESSGAVILIVSARRMNGEGWS